MCQAYILQPTKWICILFVSAEDATLRNVRYFQESSGRLLCLKNLNPCGPQKRPCHTRRPLLFLYRPWGGGGISKISVKTTSLCSRRESLERVKQFSTILKKLIDEAFQMSAPHSKHHLTSANAASPTDKQDISLLVALPAVYIFRSILPKWQSFRSPLIR